MANFSSLNGISCDSVSSVNGTSKSSINNVDGLETCDSSAATRLVTFSKGHYSFLDFPLSDSAATNIATLQSNETVADDDFNDNRQPVYGKDGSGNPMYAVTNDTTHDLVYTITPDNVTAKAAMSKLDNPDNHSLCSDDAVDPCRKLFALGWGNDVWIATTNSLGIPFDESGVTYTFHDGSTGPGPFLWRSTDGWSTANKISLAHLTNLPSTANGGVGGGTNNGYITALTTDGAGNWWFGIGKYIFKSTDDGLTWAEEASITIGGGNFDSKGCGIRGLVNTNGILICVYQWNDGSSNESRVIAAPTSNTSSGWGTPVSLVALTGGGTQPASFIPAEDDPATMTPAQTAYSAENGAMRIAAAAGRVVVADKYRVVSFDVTTAGGVGVVSIVGPVTRLTQNVHDPIWSIVTDGKGTWYAGGQGYNGGPDGLGRIWRSTDNGVTWTLPVGLINTEPDYGKAIKGLILDVYLPL